MRHRLTRQQQQQHQQPRSYITPTAPTCTHTHPSESLEARWNEIFTSHKFKSGKNGQKKIFTNFPVREQQPQEMLYCKLAIIPHFTHFLSLWISTHFLLAFALLLLSGKKRKHLTAGRVQRVCRRQNKPFFLLAQNYLFNSILKRPLFGSSNVGLSIYLGKVG